MTIMPCALLSRFAHSLALHPARPPRDATALAGVTLEVRGAHTGSGLHLTYVLEGPLERLSIPIPTAAPARADRLWEHTCFELFAGVPGSTRYAEYNFAPTLQWAAYGFRDYRDNDHIAQDKLAAPRARGAARGPRCSSSRCTWIPRRCRPRSAPRRRASRWPQCSRRARARSPTGPRSTPIPQGGLPPR